MCDECRVLREHYPRDPEVRLERVRLFFPNCIYCGARYIQWIQRKSGRPADALKRECRRVLERWMAHYHDEAELRALAKQSKWAVEPAARVTAARASAWAAPRRAATPPAATHRPATSASTAKVSR